jgi:hypothetical protein
MISISSKPSASLKTSTSSKAVVAVGRAGPATTLRQPRNPEPVDFPEDGLDILVAGGRTDCGIDIVGLSIYRVACAMASAKLFMFDSAAIRDRRGRGSSGRRAAPRPRYRRSKSSLRFQPADRRIIAKTICTPRPATP